MIVFSDSEDGATLLVAPAASLRRSITRISLVLSSTQGTDELASFRKRSHGWAHVAILCDAGSLTYASV